MRFPTNTKPMVWGAVVGAVACMIVGFSWGGWVTGGTARKDAATAAPLVRADQAAAGP